MKDNFFEFRRNISYENALRYQSFLSGEGVQGLFCFEAKETITLGRASEESEILVSKEFLSGKGIDLVQTERGGRATWHGPGQVVGFPIIDLKKVYKNSRAVRRFSEELLMGLAQACTSMGVKEVSIRDDCPGLWTARGKLISLGISIKNGVVFHGFSVNVRTSAKTSFSLIRPCGQVNPALTSLEDEGVQNLDVQTVAKLLVNYIPMLVNKEKKSTQLFDEQYDKIVGQVVRTPMAFDYLSTSLKQISSDYKI